MAIEKKLETQTEVATWAADNTQRVEIDNTGRITELALTVELTPSATLDGANAPHGIFRMMRNVRVEGGSHTYFALPDDDGALAGLLLRSMNALDGMGAGHNQGEITAPTKTYVPLTWWLHCGVKPMRGPGQSNIFDLSGFIPNVGRETVALEWTVSGNDVLDDATTITSAVLRITRALVRGDEGSIQAEMHQQMARHGITMPPGAVGMIPAWTTTKDSPTAAASDFGRELNIPTDMSYLRRIGILTQDATATRTLVGADLVQDFKVSVNGNDIIKARGDQFNARLPYGSALEDADGAIDFGNAAERGIYILDLTPFGETGYPSENYGLNMHGVPSSAAKLAYTVNATVAAGDDVLVIYERYKAIYAR